MGYYKDLREYIQVLDKNGKLHRIRSEINKDTELMPLVRWQFRGLPKKDRKAFLFENVTDARARKYNGSVLVGAHAASDEIYALAMMCQTEEIMEKWEQAQLHPIKPKMVKSGLVQEEIHIGSNLLEHDGLGEFPIPISTPGFDNAPYFSAANWVSSDPETGIMNIGNYRAMVKSPTRTGVLARMPQHIRMHWEKCGKMGIPMPVAAVIGAAPNIGLVAVTKIPYGVDEYDIAGGIAGKPVEVVKCQTSDLVVPANAEIVVEGEMPTNYLEREGPFGEHTGYIMGAGPNMVVNVTCITHRKRPIWNAFISQFPPSESSSLRLFGTQASYYKLLKHDLGVDPLVEVAVHEESGSYQFVVLSLKRCDTSMVWKALHGAAALDQRQGKIIIAVNDDINPRDLDSVVWALCYRMQPYNDTLVIKGKTATLDPSSAPPEEVIKRTTTPPSSAILIDATMKWDYPPIALPKKEYMERAKELWQKLGLPALTPKEPWYGRSLGYWPKEFEEEAELAVRGEHYQTGEKLARKRTEV